MSFLWAVNAGVAIIRLFDVNITVKDKEGAVVRTISRKGVGSTTNNIKRAVISVLLCGINVALRSSARKKGKKAMSCCCEPCAEDNAQTSAGDGVA